MKIWRCARAFPATSLTVCIYYFIEFIIFTKSLGTMNFRYKRHASLWHAHSFLKLLFGVGDIFRSAQAERNMIEKARKTQGGNGVFGKR